MFRTSILSKLAGHPRKRLFWTGGMVLVAAAIVLLLLSAKSSVLGNKVQALLGKEPVSLDQFATRIADVYCHTLKECNPGAELEARSGYGDFEAKCRVEWENRFREDVMAGMAEAMTRGTFNYNSMVAEECLKKLSVMGCRVFDADVYEVCTDTFQGETEDGTCKSGYECKPGQRCEVENQCPGVCVPKSGLAQPCRSSGDCATGLFCSERTATCAPLIEVGASCDPSAGEFQCVEGSICKDRKCVSYNDIYIGAQGDSCDLMNRCRPGLACAMGGEDNRCEALAAPGGACKVAYPSQCPEGHFCTANPTFGQIEGVCEAARGENGDCNSNLQCANPLRCVEGKCRKVGRRGEQCQANADCWSTNCSKGICEEADPCDVARVAQSG